MKISIKALGINAKTDDLSMGLSILNQIRTNGLREEVLVKRSFLEELVAKLEEIVSTFGYKNGLEKPATTDVYSEVEEAKEIEEVALAKKEERKVYRTKFRGGNRNNWSKKEDLYLYENLDKGLAVMRKDEYLRQRHSKNAVDSRFNIILRKYYRSLSADRRNLFEGLDAQKVKNLDVPDREYLPSVKSLSKAHLSHRTFKAWTEDEIQTLKDNPSLTAKKLANMLGRTTSSILVKRNRLGIKNTINRQGSKLTKWTEAEFQTIRDNKDLSSSKIAKLLPGRTVQSVSTKRGHLGLGRGQQAGRIWSEEQEKVLMQNINTNPKTLSNMEVFADKTEAQISSKRYVMLKNVN